jgi:hypothetical protein
MLWPGSWLRVSIPWKMKVLVSLKIHKSFKDPQERFQRYVRSYMSEVSDPEYWMDVHYVTDEIDG